MPRDASQHWKLFMVDTFHVRTGQLLTTAGPLTERKAAEEKTKTEKKDARLFAVIRRATEQEMEE